MKWTDRKLGSPKPVSVSLQDMVSTDFLMPELDLPFVVKPNHGNIDLLSWAKNNSEFIESKLLQYGGVLFRGFNVNSQEEFNEFVNSQCQQLLHYTEGATPRTLLTNNVYTSTEFPPSEIIAQHNELSYVTTWPRKIWFFCLKPADEGGETPIADVGKVHDSIDSEVKEKFAEKGWMLTRNYGEGFGLPWQDVFHVDTKDEVAEYCRNNRMEFEWKDANHLRTRQIRPAIIPHPDTKKMLWFNHIAFWHESSLDDVVRKTLLNEFGRENLPYNTYYGDGSIIEDSVIEHINEAYHKHTISFPWEKGDLLVLDNMRVSHGRNSFKGTRKTLVAMGEPFTRTDL